MTDPPADMTDLSTDSTDPPGDSTDPPADMTDLSADSTGPPADMTDLSADSTGPPADMTDLSADSTGPPADPRGTAGGVAAGLRVLVVTVVHDPEDARIRHRQLVALRDAGAEVTYAAPFAGYGRVPPAGVRALDLPRARGRRRLGAVRAARRLVRDEAAGHDVVLVHDPELLLALAGLPHHAAGYPVVRVWDVHEDTAVALGMRGWLPGPLRRPAAAAVRLLERWADRRLRLLLAEDAYARRFTRRHPVVPNTIVVPARQPTPPQADRAVYLGRLTVPRGALELVELGRLTAGRVRVELVGPADPDCAPAIRRAQERGWVHHHGFVPNDRALELLDGALAGLSLLHDEPNYAHSRPTKAMEYMAHGIPVITTPNPISVELVQRYGCGVVVPFDDPGATADALLALQSDPDRRLRLGAAGRAAAVQDLDWRHDGERFVRTLSAWAEQAGRQSGAGSASG
jgi:glycosyltransferase involved in cell wall biosynthesis